MHFERLQNTGHRLYEPALALYRASFPAHELREPASQERILADGEYHFTLIHDGDAFAGLVLYWETADWIYVEHFCIQPQLRNRGCGQRALALLAGAGKPVILEIDPPADELSRRRKAFYRRCGFAENPYPHVHPPYHRGNKGHDLVVMSAPAAITPEEYAAFRDHLERRVMKDAF